MTTCAESGRQRQKGRYDEKQSGEIVHTWNAVTQIAPKYLVEDDATYQHEEDAADHATG